MTRSDERGNAIAQVATNRRSGTRRSVAVTLDVAQWMRQGWLADEARLRAADAKKVLEVEGMLEAMRGAGRIGTLVDAAAGLGYVGVCAVRADRAAKTVLWERDAARVARASEAAARLGVTDAVRCVTGDLDGSGAGVVEGADALVALHACGPAADTIVSLLASRRIPWAFVAPCCYADRVPFAPVARAWAEALGVPREAAIRRRFVESLVDAARTRALEAAGYDVTVAPFVPPGTGGHVLAWRCRWSGEAGAMHRAAAALARLHEPGAG